MAEIYAVASAISGFFQPDCVLPEKKGPGLGRALSPDFSLSAFEAAPRLVLHNATGEARRFRLELEVRAVKPRTMRLVGAGAVDVGEGRATVVLGAFWLPEGRSEWELETGEIATPQVDGRELSVAVYAVRMIGVTE